MRDETHGPSAFGAQTGIFTALTHVENPFSFGTPGSDQDGFDADGNVAIFFKVNRYTNSVAGAVVAKDSGK